MEKTYDSRLTPGGIQKPFPEKKITMIVPTIYIKQAYVLKAIKETKNNPTKVIQRKQLEQLPS